MLNEENKQDNTTNNKNVLKNYAKYSVLGFQMMVIIGLFTYAGYKIDNHKQSKTPFYTAGFSLAGVVISLYFVFKGLKENNK